MIVLFHTSQLNAMKFHHISKPIPSLQYFLSKYARKLIKLSYYI